MMQRNYGRTLTDRFHTWRQFVFVQQSERKQFSVAVQFHNQCLLRHSFSLWRRWRQAKQLQEFEVAQRLMVIATHHSTSHLKSSSMQFWHSWAQQHAKAKALHGALSARFAAARAIVQWRRYVGRTQERNTLLHAAQLQFHRSHKKRAIAMLLRNVHQRREKRQIYAHITMVKARMFFAKWKREFKLYRLLREKQRLAEMHRLHAIRKAAWQQWREHSLVRRMVQVARQFDLRRRRRHIWRHWHRQVPKQRLQTMACRRLDRFVSTKSSNVVRKRFNHWRMATAAYITACSFASALASHRNLRLRYSVFVMWRITVHHAKVSRLLNQVQAQRQHIAALEAQNRMILTEADNRSVDMAALHRRLDDRESKLQSSVEQLSVTTDAYHTLSEALAGAKRKQQELQQELDRAQVVFQAKVESFTLAENMWNDTHAELMTEVSRSKALVTTNSAVMEAIYSILVQTVATMKQQRFSSVPAVQQWLSVVITRVQEIIRNHSSVQSVNRVDASTKPTATEVTSVDFIPADISVVMDDGLNTVTGVNDEDALEDDSLARAFRMADDADDNENISLGANQGEHHQQQLQQRHPISSHSRQSRSHSQSQSQSQSQPYPFADVKQHADAVVQAWAAHKIHDSSNDLSSMESLGHGSAHFASLLVRQRKEAEQQIMLRAQLTLERSRQSRHDSSQPTSSSLGSESSFSTSTSVLAP
jgi:predicted  nucleic acid-binding Zn-ribbon protein